MSKNKIKFDSQSENLFKVKEENLLINLDPKHFGFKVREKGEKISSYLNWFSYKKNGYTYEIKELISIDINDNKLEAKYETQNNNILCFSVIISGNGVIKFSFLLENDSDIDWINFNLKAYKNEHFYGFGEKYNELDQKGNYVDLWVKNGASGDDTYKPVPFYFSNKLYGIFVDTSCRTICQMGVPGEEEKVNIKVNDKKLEFYLFLADNPKDIIKKYTAISGRPSLPPPWSFGPWKSRFAADQRRHVIYEDADKHREKDIPCSVIVLDGWWDQNLFSPSFDSKYPDGENMLKELHNQEYKVVGWVSPWVIKEGRSSLDWEKCNKKGYFVKDNNGDSYVCQLSNNPHSYGSLLDFTNPEVEKLWKDRIKSFIELGIDGIKTDFGEQIPFDSNFFNGKTGREMHNIYPRIYNKLTWEVIKKIDGVLFGRSAWAGSQKYPGVWAGDQTADFCPWSGMGSAITAGQSAALSGFPFWTSDIGGYFSSPTDECFIRWTQFSAFSPWMQIHGNGCHEPWNFENQTELIYKKYAEIHMRLFPYLYSYAKIAAKFGLPLIRPMVLDYYDDNNIYKLNYASYQYKLGQEFLVAPIYWDNMNYRLVYLPEGNWMDFWTNEVFQGNQIIKADAQIDKIPVYIKEGSIIPLLINSKDTLINNESHDIELLIYCGDNNRGFFEMYEGTTFKYNREKDSIRVKINSKSSRKIKINILDHYNNFASDIIYVDKDMEEVILGKE